MSTTEAQPLFFTKKQQTKSGKWITVTYCNKCTHRAGSRKIHENLHILDEEHEIDLTGHHNNIIGKYWEIFDSFKWIEIPWTDLDPMKTVVRVDVSLSIRWDKLTAMTAIDREIRNILRPSSADLDKEKEERDYYSAQEPIHD